MNHDSLLDPLPHDAIPCGRTPALKKLCLLAVDAARWRKVIAFADIKLD